jgi:elongation factor 3
MGVRSNTRAILKMSNCTFTYPGRSEPSLFNVSCALSLSRCALQISRHNACTEVRYHSRVGVVGPNGAGKSTLIKLLTVRAHCDVMYEKLSVAKGETSPQEGTVYKHPALRVGYVSQHATHHIGMTVA